MLKTMKLNEKDNVVVCLEDGKAGEMIEMDIEGERVTIQLKEDISFGHKMAARDIETGEKVIKYGEVIGGATELIAQGDHAHVHNIESLRVRHDLQGEKV